MNKRGQKPKGKVKIKWSSDFAYAIGLLVTDGCLYSDRRHISFVSKDREQIKNFIKCLELKVKIGVMKSGSGFISSRVQFGDVLFFNFLEKIGLSPAKSMKLKEILIPPRYFWDFLRGCFDGDGYSYSYWDPRWKSSFMFYVGFVSASRNFILWLRKEIGGNLGITGHITTAKKINVVYQLKYSKYEAKKLVYRMYKNKDGISLKRKRLKINKSLAIMSKSRIQ